MKIDWSTYKITLLLYFGILLFPIIFYFSYSAFSEIQRDTNVLNTLTQTSSSILLLDKEINHQEKDKILKNIDYTFKELRRWMVENDNKRFYVGSESLIKKYDSLLDCWNSTKDPSESKSIACYKKLKPIIFSIENMLKLKQSRIYNIFYINLFTSMAILVSLIFLIRAYIYKQLRKNAIYDLTTNFHTKDYMLATLKEMIAKNSRNKESLSVMYIDVHELKTIRKTSQRNKVLKGISSSLFNSLRLSDILCRYGENEFIIILPDAKEEHFKLLTTRLEENLNTLEFTMKVTEHKTGESSEDFLTRVI